MALADDIIEKVDRKEQDTARLRSRMDEDYRKRWLLEDYKDDRLWGYAAYTTNESRTYARKSISMLSGAAMTVQVPHGNDDRDSRDDNNSKERFIIGNYRANDERLSKIGLTSLRQTMSFTLPIFGYTTGRCLLMKEKGQSWADATPWNPMEVMWEFGHKGLLWICHKSYKLIAQIESEWNITASDSKPYDAVVEYDYYDTERNVVIIPAIRDTPVKNKRHGLRDEVPGWVVSSSLQPPIVRGGVGGNDVSGMELADATADYGESIFAENRHGYDDHNFAMSIYKELTRRSLRPVFGITSADGTKVVPDADPWGSGTEIALAQGEQLIVYDFIRAQQDMIPYMTMLSGEMQRGGLPVIMHGETPAAISGYAMNTLRAGVSDKVLPLAQAQSTALKQIANIWCDQFVTNSFGSMELSGQGKNRKWFSATITPDMMQDLAQAEIKLSPQLPEDNAGKVQTALMYRQPGIDGMPLKSDFKIREDDLQMEDSDLEYDAILQQMAMSDELVKAQRMTDSLAKRGDEAAQWWHMRFMMLVQKLQQAGVPLEDAEPPNVNTDGGGGFNPQVLPRSVQGLPPPTPTPQQGPLVAPGTPRPGAQTPNGGGLGRGMPPLL
jgi:hypothetical protein